MILGGIIVNVWFIVAKINNIKYLSPVINLYKL